MSAGGQRHQGAILVANAASTHETCLMVASFGPARTLMLGGHPAPGSCDLNPMNFTITSILTDAPLCFTDVQGAEAVASQGLLQSCYERFAAPQLLHLNLVPLLPVAGLIHTFAAGRLAGLLEACHCALCPLLDLLVVAGELLGLQRELLGPRRGRPLGHALREGHGSTECEGSLSFLESPLQLEKNVQDSAGCGINIRNVCKV